MNPNNVQGPPPAGLPPQNHNGLSGLNLQMPAPDLQTMEERCQPTMNGRGRLIAPDMALKFLFKYFPPPMVTKLRNDISNFCQLPDESLFEAWEHYKLLIDRWGTFMKRRPKECYDLIENITAHHNDWDTSAHMGESSSSITSFSSEIAALTQQMAKIRKDILQINCSNQQVNYVTPSCKSCDGPHSYYESQAVGGYTQDVYATSETYNLGGNAYQPQVIEIQKSFQERPQGLLPRNTIPNPRADLKVERDPKTIMNQLPPAPASSSFVIPEKNLHQPLILYPLRLNKEKLQDKSDIQIHSFLQMVKKLYFNISFPEALAYMPKYAKMVKDLLTNRDKLLDLKKLILPELTPTHMTLKLATRTVAYPAGIAKDVFVKVGKFTLTVDFVVVDYDVDPRVPIILGRPFLWTTHALVDVHGEELTLRVGDEKLVFNVELTSKCPQKHGDESVHMIDIFDTTCEDRFHEVLNVQKSINPLSGSLTPSSDPVVESLFPYFTPFEDSDFLLEETDAFLSLDDLILPAWKIFDIRGIDPNFCTHKILTEDDFKPVVQHQKKVNPKIHEVIKAKVIKLLDVGLIYPISDSPWVSLIHVVPKKGGMPVITNENNELIPTRLVTGWRVCTDYRKLNDATRNDHFPLPFMDQMLEHLVGKEFYCFLDGFSGYFQFLIDPQDQEKTTFTCPYGTFAYRRMPFGLCNAPGTFQRCMVAIFYDIIEKTMEVFMDDFLVFRDSFSSCLSH
nr:hypothetical protein [Tanacetum cinerariifolium]